MRGRRLHCLLGIVVLLFAVQSYAQDDTLRVINSYGEPAETVGVPIWLDNTFNVAGITFRIVFSPDILTALEVDTAGTRVSGVFTHFPTQIDNDSGVVVWYGINFYDPYNNYITPGSGPVAYVMFEVELTAPIGAVDSIRFEDGDDITNNLSDRWGTMIIPALENGIFTVSGVAPNYPPVVHGVPDTSIYEGQYLEFTVTAHDPEGDSLTLWGENLPANSSFPTIRGDSIVSSIFSFTPDFTQSGTHVVSFIAEDDSSGRADTARSTIQVIELPNALPVFLPIPGGDLQSVREGDTLSFTVTAYDPDGDSLDLWATGLPANATFPTVSGDSIVSSLFNFVPDYTQGPDTIAITFHARDELGGTRIHQITVIVEDIPYSILSVDTVGGGLPSATSCIFSVALQNADSIYGLQFDLNYDPSILTINDLTPLDRLSGFVVYHNIGDSLGTVRVLVMSYGLSTIPPGSGAILDFSCNVDFFAPPGPIPLTLSNGLEVVDIYGTTRELMLEDGFFTVDRLGDITLNGEVNIGDAVALVAYILGQISFNTRQLALADVNTDGNINVGDVVGIINIILSRPIAPPLVGTDYLADAYLLFDPFASPDCEASVVIRTEVPIAGIQLKLEYDPTRLFFSSPMTTEVTQGFAVASRKVSGELAVLLYDIKGGSIPSGESTILRLPADVSMQFEDNLHLELAEVILADTLARVIPVRVQSRIGAKAVLRSFSLSQNYPNPFFNSTKIFYVIPSSVREGRITQRVTLRIYNATGSLVNTLLDQEMLPGIYSIEWDGTDSRGMRVSSGIYFYNLKAENYSITKKMMVLR